MNSQQHSIERQRLYNERNHYFTGKYMTARDFRDEQYYFLSHQHWHQAYLHDWGIVWGLKVSVEGQCVTISPGMALDCYGRELVLGKAVRFSTEELRGFPSHGQPASHLPDKCLIGLQYDVAQRELVPVLIDDECSPNHPKHNRVQERARICYQPHCEDCWSYPPVSQPAILPRPVEGQADRAHAAKDDCDGCIGLGQHQNADECSCPESPIAFEPNCACGSCGFVPLASLTRTQCGSSWQADDKNCRYVRGPFYGEALTHIVGINWSHGGKTLFSDLLESYEASSERSLHANRVHEHCGGRVGRIVLEFDRALQMPSECANEASAYFAQLIHLDYTVLMSMSDRESHDLDGDDAPEAVNLKAISLSKCRRKLLIDFPAHRMHRDLPVRIRLSVNCDMVIDERGRAVDGNHLHGKVPRSPGGACQPVSTGHRSGNGLEGGTFYSWTKLSPSHHSSQSKASKVDSLDERNL